MMVTAATPKQVEFGGRNLSNLGLDPGNIGGGESTPVEQYDIPVKRSEFWHLKHSVVQFIWLLAPFVGMSLVSAGILLYKFNVPLLYWHHLYIYEETLPDSEATMKRLASFGLDDAVSSICAWCALSFAAFVVWSNEVSFSSKHLKLVGFTSLFSLTFWTLRDVFVQPFGKLAFFLTDYGLGPPWLMIHHIIVAKIFQESTKSKSNFLAIFGLAFAYTNALGAYLFGINVLFALPSASENFRSMVRLLLHPPLRAATQYASLSMCYFLEGHNPARTYALFAPCVVFLALASHVMLSTMSVVRTVIIMALGEAMSEFLGQRIHLVIAKEVYKRLSPFQKSGELRSADRRGSDAKKANTVKPLSTGGDSSSADAALSKSTRSSLAAGLRAGIMAPVLREDKKSEFFEWFSRSECRQARVQFKMFVHLVDMAAVPFGVIAVYLMHTSWDSNTPRRTILWH